MFSVLFSIIILLNIQIFNIVAQKIENTQSNKNDSIVEIFNQCYCVQYYLCDDDNFIIQDGKGVIDYRFAKDKNATDRYCNTFTTNKRFIM